MVKREELQKLIKEKILLVGEAGSGKTYTSVKLAEFIASHGYTVIYIDPEYGAERELLNLSDDALDHIELIVAKTWPELKNAIEQNNKCFIKIVDSFSDALEHYKRYLESKFIAQGYYLIGEKEISIKDPDTFKLPWQSYSKLYDAFRDCVFTMLEHDYHILTTMHPLKGTDTKESLQQDIFRKYDTVIETRRAEGDTVKWYGVVKKNRGREDETLFVKINDVANTLIKLFEKRLGGSKK